MRLLANLIIVGALTLFASGKGYGQAKLHEAEDLEVQEELGANYGPTYGHDYLTNMEKSICYYLNFARTDPKKFAERYVVGYDGEEGHEKGYGFDARKKSLLKTLLKMEPVGELASNEELFKLASCFAETGGQLGILGHDRKRAGCPTYTGDGTFGECCSYGSESALAIVIGLLIDTGKANANLGHRKICLDPTLTKVGIAIRPHKTYRFCAVLDFGG